MSCGMCYFVLKSATLSSFKTHTFEITYAPANKKFPVRKVTVFLNLCIYIVKIVGNWYNVLPLSHSEAMFNINEIICPEVR